MYQTDFDAENKIWSGRKIVGPLNPNITVGQAVLWVLQGSPNQIGQVKIETLDHSNEFMNEFITPM